MQIPKGYYAKAKKKVRVVITNEQKNRAVMMESLSKILMSVAKAPQILQDPKLKKLFNKIMEMAGISPIEMDVTEAVPQPGMAPATGAPGTPTGTPIDAASMPQLSPVNTAVNA